VLTVKRWQQYIACKDSVQQHGPREFLRSLFGKSFLRSKTVSRPTGWQRDEPNFRGLAVHRRWYAEPCRASVASRKVDKRHSCRQNRDGNGSCRWDDEGGNQVGDPGGLELLPTAGSSSKAIFTPSHARLQNIQGPRSGTSLASV
jgi:hypothetical protein